MQNIMQTKNKIQKKIRIMDESRQDIKFFQFRDLKYEVDDIYNKQSKNILNYVKNHKEEKELLPNISDIYFLYNNSCNKPLGYIYVKETKKDKQLNLIQLIEVVEGERRKGYGTYMINEYYERCNCRCIPECIGAGSEQFWIKQFQEGGAYEHFGICNHDTMKNYLTEKGFRYGDEIWRSWVLHECQGAGEVLEALDEWSEEQAQEEEEYSDDE
tara:strand:+ start:250 stop:891 length:642 start_codon:yes stop_codon:yes gene_type:complete